MRRLLLVYLIALSSQLASAQVKMYADTINSGCTSTVDVPIRVKDFVNMLSMQGTIGWNTTYLSYNSIVNYGPGSIGLTNGNFGFGSTSSGKLMFSWNDANLSGETLPNSTIMFTLRFNVVGAGSFSTPITFPNTPTPFEFVDLSYAPIPYTTANGAVNISCSTCSINSIVAGTQTACNVANNTYTQQLTVSYTAPPGTGSLSVNNQLFPITGSPQTIVLSNLPSDGNPVNVDAFFTANPGCLLNMPALFTAPPDCIAAALDIYADVVDAALCAPTVDVPIRVNDFVNMLSMQGTVNWNPADLSFNSIVDYGPASMSMSNGNFGFGSTGSGNLMFSWNDNDLSSETQPDSTIIFTIRFNVLGTGVFSTPVSFQNSPTPLEFVNNTFTPIPYLTYSGAVNINCSACNISGVTTGSQSGCNPANNYYTQSLTVSYSNAPSTGYLSVNNQLFPITGSPQVLLLDSLPADGNPVDLNIFFTNDPGCQLLANAAFTAPTNCLVNSVDLFADVITDSCATYVDVPVRVSDFNAMLSMQGTINWNTAYLAFNSIVDYGPSNLALTNGNFGLGSVSSGNLMFSWNDADLSGESLSDSTIVCVIRFNITGNGSFSTPIAFVNSPTPLEFVNTSLTPIPYSTTNGSVNITCPPPNEIDLYFTEYTCTPDSVYTIDVTANNFVNIVSYQGTVAWDTALFVFDNISYYGPGNVLMTNGNFGLPLVNQGLLTFSWYDADLSGEDLADSTILFSFVLNAVNPFGCTDVTYANAPTPLEFIDSLTQEVPTATSDLSLCKSFTYYDSLEICFGDSALIAGVYQNTSGIYIDSLLTVTGCDSLISYTLNVLPENAVTDVRLVCDSLTWIDGITYYSDNNTATWVLTGTNGCDSTITLDLTVLTATFTTDTQTACDSYIWIDGNTYTASNNTATWVLANAAGCDSTITLDLTILNSTTSTDVQTACDSLIWMDGNNYTSSNNTATWVLTNSVGCDSTITLDLTILNSTISTDVQTACDSYTWIDGNTYTTSNNTATWILTNAAGCDSTITLDLTINSSTTGIDAQIACDSLVWIDGNTYYTDNNTATWTLTNTAGCDSLVTLDLTIVFPTTGTDVQTACDSYTWIDGNTYTVSNNTATWVLTNSVGCDSTVTLDLTILNSTSSTDVQTACDSYTWMDGNTYTSSNNTATWVLTNSVGCDSTITLDLTILNSTVSTDIQTACDSYTWIDGNTYTTSNNTATWILTNAAGCDSTITLDLTINSSTTGIDAQIACDSLVWIDGNTYYTDNNTATWTLTNAAGCDSLVTLDLTIVFPTTGTDVQTACDSYTWIDGNTYTTSNNTAIWVLTNAAGCDSTITLDLTILNSTSSTDVQTACDSYTWIDGNTYTSSNNTATWVLSNSVGCDSTITLDLTLLNSTTSTDVQTACDSYTWIDGNTYTTSNNTATWVIPNAVGCDSTITLDLTIGNSTTGTETQTACESFTWVDGVTYFANNNTATWITTNAAGCDSTVTLNLTIVYPSSGTDVQTACDSYTWIDGNTYTVSNNTATWVLTNSVGCDSTVTLDLTILNSTSSTDVQTACDSYTWMDGNTYTSSNNTATWVLTNSVGCDSTITLDLTILNSTVSTDVQTACDSYTWIDGNTYTTSNNTATWVLTNAVGCDSTITLDLTINSSTTGIDTQIACDSLVWIDGNTYYTDNNTATWTLTNAAGCDSLVTLDLTIVFPTAGTDVQTACDSYTWIDGNTYTTSNNTAIWVLTNAAGCDSTVTLDLTILNSTTGTDLQTACDSYTWMDGNTYTSSNNTATWVLTNAAGCDSTVTLNLSILNSTSGTDVQTACGSYTWINGTTYTSSNNTATWVLTNAAGCDSTITLNLTINTVNVGVSASGNTFTANQNNAQYQWINCATNAPVAGATNQNFTPTSGGNYAVIVTYNGCTDTSACVTSTVGLESLIADGHGIHIYPNPTAGDVFISFEETTTNVSIRVINNLGQIAEQRYYSAIESDHFYLQGDPGMYLLEITTGDGQYRLPLIRY